jgi:short-subunit dehydrogenase
MLNMTESPSKKISESKNWQGKTVWITGASSGIGRCLALDLASMGATVIVSARNKAKLVQLANLFPQKIIVLAVDVADASQIDAVRSQLGKSVESIDVAIFAAGVVEYENDLVFDDQTYRKVFDVNFFGLVNSVAMAMPLLKKSGFKPYIVGLTSLTVVIGFPRAEIYGSAKAAADYFLKSLRMDLPQEDFDISIVRPGFVKTPMTAVNDFPMPFIMSAENAAQRIIKGMNSRQLFINFPGRFYWILNVLSGLPTIWYRWLAPKIRR